MSDVKKRLEAFRGAVNTIIDNEYADRMKGLKINPTAFKNALRSCVTANSSLFQLNKSQFADVIRRCASLGMVPDGREISVYLTKNGQPVFIPMKEGLLRVFARNIKDVEIYSDYVLKGDNVKVTKDPVNGDSIFHERANPFEAVCNSQTVIGAYCMIKLKGKAALLHTFNKSDILNIAPSSPKPDSPWAKWYHKMAEKACIKSAMNKYMYLVDSVHDPEQRDALVSLIQDEAIDGTNMETDDADARLPATVSTFQEPEEVDGGYIDNVPELDADEVTLETPEPEEPEEVEADEPAEIQYDEELTEQPAPKKQEKPKPTVRRVQKTVQKKRGSDTRPVPEPVPEEADGIDDEYDGI